MSKRVMMVGLAVGVGLATLQGGIAEAQWSFAQPPGMWWYWGSFHGCATITKVPNPDAHPALLACDVTVTAVQTLCQNPSFKDVTGEAATKFKFSGTNKFDTTDLDTKTKGKANLCANIDDSLAGHDELCVNPNWHLKDWLTTQFEATCTTRKCLDAECTSTKIANTQVCQCTLPSEWTVENKPPACTPVQALAKDPACEAYTCIELDGPGGNWTGGYCQLPQ